MLRPSRTALLLLLLLGTTTGCATLVGGGSSQPVSIRSTPPSASFVIRSSSGIDIAQGQTPDMVRLPRKHDYQLEFTAPGFQTQRIALTRGTNGWIFGNLFIGWILGFAIDFATGSAYKIEPAMVNITLVQQPGTGDTLETAAAITIHDEKGRLLRTMTVPLVPLENTPAAR